MLVRYKEMKPKVLAIIRILVHKDISPLATKTCQRSNNLLHFEYKEMKPKVLAIIRILVYKDISSLAT